MYTVYTSKHAQCSKTRKDSSARVHFVIPQIIWIGSYEYVLCGCVLSLTSGVYKMDLGYTTAYKETQVQLDQSFWGISIDVVGALSLSRYTFGHPINIYLIHQKTIMKLKCMNLSFLIKWLKEIGITTKINSVWSFSWNKNVKVNYNWLPIAHWLGHMSHA